MLFVTVELNLKWADLDEGSTRLEGALMRSQNLRTKRNSNHNDEKINLYISESFGVGITVVMIFFGIALFTHHPDDSTMLHFQSDLFFVRNWGGTVGAELSVMLYHLLGAAAYFLVGALGVIAYMFLLGYRQGRSWLSLLLLPVCIAAAAFVVSLYNIDFVHGLPGGMIGYGLNTFLTKLFGFYGATMIGWSTLWISLVLVLRVSIVRGVISLIRNIATSSVAFFF
jgi:hypothetical protein